jgi:hypothetical protein
MPAQQFVLLPRDGLHATNESSRRVLMNLPFASSTDSPVITELPTAPGGPIRILDTIIERRDPLSRETAAIAQLVEMQTEAAEAVNAQAGPFVCLP